MSEDGHPDHQDALPPRQVQDDGEHDRREGQRHGQRAQAARVSSRKSGESARWGRPLRRKNTSTSARSGGGVTGAHGAARIGRSSGMTRARSTPRARLDQAARPAGSRLAAAGRGDSGGRPSPRVCSSRSRDRARPRRPRRARTAASRAPVVHRLVQVPHHHAVGAREAAAHGALEPRAARGVRRQRRGDRRELHRGAPVAVGEADARPAHAHQHVARQVAPHPCARRGCRARRPRAPRRAARRAPTGRRCRPRAGSGRRPRGPRRPRRAARAGARRHACRPPPRCAPAPPRPVRTPWRGTRRPRTSSRR